METLKMTIEEISEILEDKISPKDKLICMLHTDGWSNTQISQYFAGSVWDIEPDEVNAVLDRVEDELHKFIN